MNKLLRRGAMSLSALLLASCSSTNVGQADRAVTSTMQDATNYMHQAAMPLAPQDTSPVQVTDEVWTSAVARRSENGTPLPFRFESPGVSITDDRPLTLFEIGAKITEATGIPVIFDNDLTDSKSGGGSDSASGGAAAGAGAASTIPAGVSGNSLLAQKFASAPENVGAMLKGLGLASGGAPVSLPAANAAGAQGGEYRETSLDQKAMQVDFAGGPLSQVLNQVGSYFSVTWSYDGSRLRFFRNVNRTYFIHALPLESMSMDSSTDASSTSSGSSSGQTTNAATSGSSQSAKTSVQIKVWSDIEGGIKSILGDAGKMAVSRSTGTISISAPAETVNEVQNFIDGQNAILSKQVVISVEVLNLQLSDADAMNFSLDGLFKASGNAALNIGTAGTATAVSSTLGPALSYAVTRSDGTSGTNLVAQALASKGRVSVVTKTSLLTLNGIPAPLQVTHTQGYLASITTTSTANTTGTSQTSLTPGSVTYGYNLALLPQVQPDSKSMILSFSVNLSDLDGTTNGFDEFSSGGQTIELPNIISRDFTQQAEVPNGSTLVLTGFEQQNDTSNKTGAGVASFMGLGGSQNGSRTHSVLVILLTPTVTGHELITYR